MLLAAILGFLLAWLLRRLSLQQLLETQEIRLDRRALKIGKNVPFKRGKGRSKFRDDEVHSSAEHIFAMRQYWRLAAHRERPF